MDRRAAGGGEHLRAAIETERWGRTLLPHLNAKAHLALLYYERGDLESAEADAARRARPGDVPGVDLTLAGAVAAHLALAGVHLDWGDLEAVDEWLGWVADIEDVSPEAHVRLAGRRPAGSTAAPRVSWTMP